MVQYAVSNVIIGLKGDELLLTEWSFKRYGINPFLDALVRLRTSEAPLISVDCLLHMLS